MKFSLGRFAARTLLVAATAGALAVGAYSTAEASPSIPAAAPSGSIVPSVFSMPSWCPFGTHGGAGGGCRGGGIPDNERVNQAFKDTGQEFLDAGECALKGVIQGMATGDPLYGSWRPAAICGSTKPEGQF